jgi:hypothetical protein
MVLMLPFIVVGAALTASIFGAIFGIPLLVGSLVAFRAGRRASRHPEDVAALSGMAWRAVLAAIVVTVAVAINVVWGWEDIDTLLDLTALVVGATWAMALWWVAMDARRASRAS